MKRWMTTMGLVLTVHAVGYGQLSSMTKEHAPDGDDLILITHDPNGTPLSRAVPLDETRAALGVQKQHWYDVTETPYNADNTGTSDSSTAFAQARAAAGSGTVYVPAGTYKFDSAIDPRSARWVGDSRGTSILRASATNSTGIFVNTDGANPLFLENLCFRSLNGGGVALDFPANHYLSGRIVNCQIAAEFEIGLRALMGDLKIENCWFGYTGTPGATWIPVMQEAAEGSSFASLNTTFDTCFFRQAVGDKAAVILDYGFTQRFVNCVFESCSTAAVDANAVDTLVIENCAFELMEPNDQVGTTGNCLIVGRYNATVGVGNYCYMRHCTFTNSAGTPFDAVYYAGGSGCWLDIEGCQGGLAAYYCKDAGGLYDGAQTLGSRGLSNVAGMHCVGYPSDASSVVGDPWVRSVGSLVMPTLAKTGDYAINRNDRSTWFTNHGAVDGDAEPKQIIFSLPTAVTYERYGFGVHDANDIIIDPSGSESFRGQGAGKYLRLDDRAASVLIECRETGVWDIVAAYDPNIADNQIFKWQP